MGSLQASTMWMLVEQAVRFVFGFLSSAYIAKHLAPQGYGELSFVIAITGIIAAIAKLGMDAIVIQDLVRWPNRVRQTLGLAMLIRLVAALGVGVVSAAILSAVGYQGKSTPTILSVVLVAAPVMQSMEITAFYYQAKTQYRLPAIVGALQAIVSAGTRVLAVNCDASIEVFVLLLLFDGLLIAAGYAWLVRGNILVPRLTTQTIRRMTRLVGRSRHLWLSAVVTIAYMRIDQLIVARYLGIAELGQYAAAVRLSELFNVVSGILCASMYPRLIKAKKESTKNYESVLIRFYGLVIWPAIAWSLIMYAAAPQLILVLYGQEYETASDILRIHACSSVFVAILLASGRVFVVENRSEWVSRRSIVALLLGLVLNVALLPTFGAVGAALSALFVFAIAGFFIDLTSGPDGVSMFRAKVCGFKLSTLKSLYEWSRRSVQK